MPVKKEEIGKDVALNKYYVIMSYYAIILTTEKKAY